MQNSKIFIIIGIIITLSLGFILGTITERSMGMHHKHKHRAWGKQEILEEKLLARLSRKLNLSQTQIQAVGGILRVQAVKINEIRNQTHAKLKTIKADTDEQIKTHLTPEQQAEYQKLVEAHKQRWEKFSAHN
jgi:Spy/CpxP family protein refolding chaperone